MTRKNLRNAMLAFAAGGAGGLVNTFVVWLFASFHITTALGVGLRPSFTLPGLYQRIVWGGIWGFLFLIPLLPNAYFVRGLLFSLGPTLLQLFVFFPLSGQGILGIQLGLFTFLFVLVFNAVWGVVGIYLFEMSRCSSEIDLRK